MTHALPEPDSRSMIDFVTKKGTLNRTFAEPSSRVDRISSREHVVSPDSRSWFVSGYGRAWLKAGL